jgi:hypothetical protein
MEELQWNECHKPLTRAEKGNLTGYMDRGCCYDVEAKTLESVRSQKSSGRARKVLDPFRTLFHLETWIILNTIAEFSLYQPHATMALTM